MAIRKSVIYSNVPSFPSGYYAASSAVTAKTVSVAADRYKVSLPSHMDVDINGSSYQLTTQTYLDANADASWDFGQDIATWTANTEYSLNQWVRPVTTTQSFLSSPEGSILPTSSVYSPTYSPSSNYGLHSHTAIVYSNYMYIFAGYRGTSVNETHRFNLLTNSWSSGQVTVTGTQPSVRLWHTAVVYNNYMYVFGGQTSGSTNLNDLHRLNLETLEWSGALSTTGTPPSIRCQHTSSVVGNYMYVFGGTEATLSDNKMYRINLDTLAWDDAFTVATTGTCSYRRTHVAGVVGTDIYIFGGRDRNSGSSYFNDLHKFNTQTNSWSGELTTSGTKPTARTGMCGIIVDNYLYVIAGLDTSSYKNDTHRINLDTLAWSGALTIRGSSFAPRTYFTTVLNSGVVYIFGGYFSGGVYPEKFLHTLNIKSNAYIYKCTAAGTTHTTTEPTWSTTYNGTTSDGSVEWTMYYDKKRPEMRAGSDYYIYACQPVIGVIPKILLSSNATYPHGYTASNSRKIGGFHCLCGSVGTISNHTLTRYLTGDILPASVWCLKHRHITGDNRGMVFIEPLNKWAYIYNASGTQFIPVSAFGGTILDTITWFQGRDAASRVGMKLPTDAEFGVLASGSNEGTNILGSADPGTVTAAVDTAGRRMISNYGCEGCCGIQWQFLDELNYRFDTAVAHTHTVAVTGDAGTFTSGNPSADVAPAWTYKANTNYKGSLYTQGTYGIVGMCAGSENSGDSNSGPLARSLYYRTWLALAYIGIRFIGNSIEK